MTEKDPLSYSVLTYAWVILISASGVFTHFLEQNRESLTMDKLKYLLIDLTIAPFTGVMTFYVCESVELSQIKTAAVIGLVSHLGSRQLCKLRTAILKRFLKLEELND